MIAGTRTYFGWWRPRITINSIGEPVETLQDLGLVEGSMIRRSVERRVQNPQFLDLDFTFVGFGSIDLEIGDLLINNLVGTTYEVLEIAGTRFALCRQVDK